MGYKCYFECDKCGKIYRVWEAHTDRKDFCCLPSFSEAIWVARVSNWTVGEKGWICPECQKRDTKKERAYCKTANFTTERIRK